MLLVFFMFIAVYDIKPKKHAGMRWRERDKERERERERKRERGERERDSFVNDCVCARVRTCVYMFVCLSVGTLPCRLLNQF